ncbi:DUF1801 domain-containing protein [Candidatus Parcubacteria bacterium]|nr:MAG: DUF1801 domain-containing protein [Candidatus Parcubacteria bacterium]
MNPNPKTVTAYITSAPPWARGTLRELRRTIRAAAPKAKESISYHMPYYSQNGRLAYFAAFKNHCSFFWISAKDKKTFKKELAAQKVVASTLQIPRGAKVPTALIKKIIRARLKENQQRGQRK